MLFNLTPDCFANTLAQYASPYYNETHAALRQEVREWVEEKVEPYVNEWEKNKFVPTEIYKEMGTRGYLPGYVSFSASSKHA